MRFFYEAGFSLVWRNWVSSIINDDDDDDADDDDDDDDDFYSIRCCRCWL